MSTDQTRQRLHTEKPPSGRVRRISWSVIAATFLITAVSFVIFWRVDRIHSNLQRVNQFYVPMIKQLNILQGQWSAYQKSYEQYVAFRKWGTKSKRKETSLGDGVPKLNPKRMVQPTLNELSRILGLAEQRFQVAAQLPELLQMQEWMKRFSDLADQEMMRLIELHSFVRTKNFAEAANIYSKARHEQLGLGNELEGITRSLENRLAVTQYLTEQEIRNSEILMLSLLTLSMLVSFFVMLRLRRWFVPMQRLTKVAQDISLFGVSSGIKFPAVERSTPAEIEVLIREFSRMGLTVLERERTIQLQKTKLENLNTLNERILNNISSGLLLINQKGYVEQVNERFCELFKLTKMQIVGANAAELLSGWPKDSVVDWLNFESSDKEFIQRRIQQDSRVFDIRVHVLQADLGRLLLFEDVTNLVEAEEKLAHARKLILAGNMSSQIAHEVRNPLNSMSLQLEMLGEDFEKTPEVQRRIAAILEQVGRLDRLTQRYLNLSQPEILGVQARKPVEMHSLIEQAITFFGTEIQSSKIQVALEFNAFENQIIGDSDSLSQVLFNLIRNSIESLNEKESEPRMLWIRTKNQGEFLLIQVEDNGSGIRSELKDKVFEPFVTHKPSGHGLGLSVSRQICIDHGGELRLANSQVGASFEVLLRTNYVVSNEMNLENLNERNKNLANLNR